MTPPLAYLQPLRASIRTKRPLRFALPSESQSVGFIVMGHDNNICRSTAACIQKGHVPALIAADSLGAINTKCGRTFAPSGITSPNISRRRNAFDSSCELLQDVSPLASISTMCTVPTRPKRHQQVDVLLVTHHALLV